MPENKIENTETTPLNDKKTESIGYPLIIHRPRKKSPIRRHLLEIIISIIFITVVITIGLCLHYIFTNEDTDNEPEIELYNPLSENADPAIKQLSQFGKLKMKGRLGSIPTIFEIDLGNGEGCRYPSSSSTTNYLVKVRGVILNPDKSFHFILTDFLEGRVAIGKFDGILSADGSTFTGEYTSHYGKVIKFKFER